MAKSLLAVAALIAAGGVVVFLLLRDRAPETAPAGFVGSATCRGCHENFYRLWAPSHHGLAMQPYSAQFARRELTPPSEETAIGLFRYRAEVAGEEGRVVEVGPGGEKRYPIEHVLGGKNVYYFLTSLDRGRLQTLPVAYDIRKKAWFDTAASGVRHFPSQEDAPLHWTDRPYTFNTSCYSCHVSQLTTNYDLNADSYHTVWAEPGINCETCHGPAGEHVRFCTESEEACREDVRIIRTKAFNEDQTNALCAPCHAKMVPLTSDFRPGDRYFDHYDLVALEHPDFYPDGRDLGENYTYTGWLMSPCARSGQLDCLHCHTSSGRYRFRGEEANNACMPCHAEKVADPPAHTRHRASSPGSRCVACHMPMTSFARMNRSDHSMRPPAPAATVEFQSPNACNLCHTDRDAKWADRIVRSWHSRDYQAAILRPARLIDAARKRDWSQLPSMLAYITGRGRDEVFAVSLIRLLRSCDDERKWAVMVKALNDPSPLVRAGAADALSGYAGPDALTALVEATRDDFRIVRIRAAAALAPVPREMLSARDRDSVERSTSEFLASLRTRPDDSASHTNLGNFYMNRGNLDAAVSSFETALRLNPQSIVTLVNASLAYNLRGENDKAEACLRRALKVEPANAAANFNLGLLLGEMGRRAEARETLRAALKTDPGLAAAAYNLCVLESESNLQEAIRWCRQAADSRPQEPKYAYTLAFYLANSGDIRGATRILRELVDRHPAYTDARMLLTRLAAANRD